MKSKLLVCGALIISIIAIVFCSCYVTHNNAQETSAELISKTTVVIDAGHGGADGGASSGNVLEKDINLEIALKLKDFLTASGYDVLLTRESDEAVIDPNQQYSKKLDLQNRVDLFNSSKNNVVISIHQNNFPQQQYSGAQIFYTKNTSNSKLLAENIRKSIVSLLQTENNRQCKAAGSEIMVLNKAEVNAVMVECGFLSNPDELKNLCDSSYQTKLAYCIYLGFLEFYNTNNLY